jgi:hypothetical protein
MLCVSCLAQEQKESKSDQLFDRHRLWTAHVHIAAAEWDRMQPGQGRGAVHLLRAFNRAIDPNVGGMLVAPDEQWRKALGEAAVAVPSTSPSEQWRRGEHARATQFSYGRAVLEFDGQTYHVAARFKGNSSYQMMARTFKKPFKIDFDRAADPSGNKPKKFHGLDKINLHNNTWDPSQAREALSYWAYRQAGVPAPRTTFVLLYLTVEGRHEKQCLGVYTLIEEVDDKDFLKANFGDKGGLLLKPEGASLAYRGDSWAPYRSLGVKGEPTPEEAEAFIRFCRLVYQADDAEFRRRIEGALDVDEFLRYLAVTVLVANMDSPLAAQHNYFMYVHPQRLLVSWMPWDNNLSIGGYQRLGAADELMDLSIDRPYQNDFRLVRRLLEVPRYRDAYHNHLERFIATFFSAASAGAEADKMETVVAEADRIAAGALTGGNPPGASAVRRWGPPPGNREFIEGRVKSVQEQLAGKHNGYVPRNRTPPVSAGWPNRGGAGPVPAVLAGAFPRIDTDADGSLSSDELSAALGELLGRIDAGAKGSVTVGHVIEWLGGSTAESRRLASLLMHEADRDLDGWLTRLELIKTARRWLKEADTDRNGALSHDEFSRMALRLWGWNGQRG